MTYLTTLLLVLALLLAPTEAIWGKKAKGKEQPKKQATGKDSAELGLQAFQELCELIDAALG